MPVATPDDLARLPGAKVTDTTLQEQIRALSAATRDFEGATNCTFSPRLRETVGLRLPTVEDTDGRPVFAEPLTDGTTRYLYVTGLPAPPDDVVRAVTLLASSYVAEGPWDDRGVAIDGGGGAMRLLTAGVGRAMFSIPAVEACAKRHRVPTIGAA